MVEQWIVKWGQRRPSSSRRSACLTCRATLRLLFPQARERARTTVSTITMDWRQQVRRVTLRRGERGRGLGWRAVRIDDPLAPPKEFKTPPPLFFYEYHDIYHGRYENTKTTVYRVKQSAIWNWPLKILRQREGNLDFLGFSFLVSPSREDLIITPRRLMDGNGKDSTLNSGRFIITRSRLEVVPWLCYTCIYIYYETEREKKARKEVGVFSVIYFIHLCFFHFSEKTVFNVEDTMA